MSQKYYAIKFGKNVEDVIVDNWEECKKLVIGYPAVFKSFKTLKEAKKYLNSMTLEMVDEILLRNAKLRRYRLRKNHNLK